jgi:NitT/TauT family transport system substrate-binding protein
LKGKTLYATGKGSSPEYALRYLLSENGIDPDKDLTIEWKSEATEIVALLSETGSGIAMLPQPYVFVAKGSVPELRVAIDLNQAWADLNNGSLMVTGVMVARKDFIEKNPAAVKAFLKEYKASTEYVNANVVEAAALIEKFDIFKAAVAEKALPYCNITYIDGPEMQTAMEGYLNVLFEQNPKSVGGKLPDDGFYYKA